MWNFLQNFTQQILDPIGIWIGLLLAVPVFWTWYEVTLGRRKRRKRWQQEIQQSQGQRPSILIIDCLKGKKSVRPKVEGFCQKHPVLQTITKDRIFEYSTDKESLAPEDMPALVDAIREKAVDVYRSGTDVLHLFYGGPAIVPFFLGREFANACQVILYQHSGGTYTSFGPLNYDLASTSTL